MCILPPRCVSEARNLGAGRYIEPACLNGVRASGGARHGATAVERPRATRHTHARVTELQARGPLRRPTERRSSIIEYTFCLSRSVAQSLSLAPQLANSGPVISPSLGLTTRYLPANVQRPGVRTYARTNVRRAHVISRVIYFRSAGVASGFDLPGRLSV